mmetsp:Transcript_25531/g.60235  ORF Transcript_25531/g.60235 Transcript_25531/m.60235 type:complete len:389 (+) Transcript_25531:22-1188(+)
MPVAQLDMPRPPAGHRRLRPPPLGAGDVGEEPGPPAMLEPMRWKAELLGETGRVAREPVREGRRPALLPGRLQPAALPGWGAERKPGKGSELTPLPAAAPLAGCRLAEAADPPWPAAKMRNGSELDPPCCCMASIMVMLPVTNSSAPGGLPPLLRLSSSACIARASSRSASAPDCLRTTVRFSSSAIIFRAYSMSASAPTCRCEATRFSSSASSLRAYSTSASSALVTWRMASCCALSSSSSRALASSASACSAASVLRCLSSSTPSSSASSCLASSSSDASTSRRLKCLAKAASSSPACLTSMLCSLLAMRSERWSLSRSRASRCFRRLAATSWLEELERALPPTPDPALPIFAWLAFSLPVLYSPSSTVAYLAVVCRFLSVFKPVR